MNSAASAFRSFGLRASSASKRFVERMWPRVRAKSEMGSQACVLSAHLRRYGVNQTHFYRLRRFPAVAAEADTRPPVRRRGQPDPRAGLPQSAEASAAPQSFPARRATHSAGWVSLSRFMPLLRAPSDQMAKARKEKRSAQRVYGGPGKACAALTAVRTILRVSANRSIQRPLPRLSCSRQGSRQLSRRAATGRGPLCFGTRAGTKGDSDGCPFQSKEL